MPRNFKLPRIGTLQVKDPRVAMRLVLGVLAVANVAAALIVFKPWGGSPEDLQRQREQLSQQLLQNRKRLETSRQLVTKVERAREEAGRFMQDFMMDRRSTYSTIVAELDRAANDAGIKPRERSIDLEPVEGSDAIYQMTITSGFEGNYSNLTRFMHVLDKSPRFLIIESLQATPQQGSGLLSISLKLDTFVRQAPGEAS